MIFINFILVFSLFSSSIYCQLDLNEANIIPDNFFKRQQNEIFGDPLSIIRENITNTYKLNDFNISSHGTFNHYDGCFKDILVSGLKSARLTLAELDYTNKLLKIIINIPIVNAYGYYFLYGSITFFKLEGNGTFEMNITDLAIEAKCELTKTSDNLFEVSSVYIDTQLSNIKIYFENLGSFSNSVLNTLGYIIFNSAKKDTLPSLQEIVKQNINSQLKTLDIETIKMTTNILFDDWIKRWRENIIQQNLDPLPLPSKVKGFSYKLYSFDIDGEINLYNGILTGLSNIIWSDCIKFIYANDSLILEAGLGFVNLTSRYLWHTRIYKTSLEGTIAFTFKQIESSIRLIYPLLNNLSIIIDKFKITKIDQFLIDIDGLEEWGSLLEIFVNIFSKTFKGAFFKDLPNPILKLIKKELNDPSKKYSEQVYAALSNITSKNHLLPYLEINNKMLTI